MAAPPADADFRIKLDEQDLLGLHILATLERVDEDDSTGFANVVTATIGRGIRTRFDAAGLEWPPGPRALEHASAVAATRAGEATARPSPAATQAPWRCAAAVALVVAAAIVLVGGYALKWSWTGLSGNDQVWDWMRLLLLPVALGTFPLWLRYSAYMSPARRRGLGGAVIAFVVFVLVGYVAPLLWTGFRGQTLWDWLTLLVLPLAFVLVQAWPASGREIRRHHVVLVIVVLVAWGVTMIGGYVGGWTWTGYAGNTLWDWVSLLLAPAAITIVGVPLARRLSGDAAALAQVDTEREARTRALQEARRRGRS